MRSVTPLFMLAAVAAGILSGCPLPRSDEGQLLLDQHGVYAAASADDYAFTGAQPVLVGTTTCPRIRCLDPCPASWERVAREGELSPEVGACFSSTVSGAGSFDGGCLHVEEEGALDWRLSSAECEYRADGGYPTGPDRFTWSGLSPGDVSAAFDFPLERVGLEVVREPSPEYVLLSPSTTEALPADFAPAPGEPVALLAGEPVRLSVGLFTSQGRSVGYGLDDALVILTEASPATDGGPALAAVEEPGDFPVVTLAPGGEVRVDLEVGEESFEVGRVVGVAAAELASLELVAFRPEPADQRNVAGFRALLRDDEGRVVYGAPVRWEIVGGRFVLGSLMSVSGRVDERRYPAGEPTPAGEPAGGWVFLSDECRPEGVRSGPRSAAVRAFVGELESVLEVEWTQQGRVRAPPAPFFEAEGCQGPDVWTPPAVDGGTAAPPLPWGEGCSCSASGSRGGPAEASLAFLASLGFWGARRHSRRRCC